MKQKNYLIIGGTSGIGRAIVKELLQRTANVADEKLFTPAYSAARLLAVLDSMSAAQSGGFVDWAGELIPW
ncbi:MAG: hypothetical protein ACTII9_03950 [Psychrobacter celer]